MVSRFNFPSGCRLLACCAVAALPASAPAAQLLVPLYAYPTANSALWNGVRDSAPNVSITGIVNPANGPGQTRDANYVKRVAELNAAGVKLAGYVYTGYGTRALNEVLADIDAYRTLYPEVTMIFVDEQSTDLATLAYYQSIYDHVAIRGYTRVFGNPGTTTDEAFTLSASIPVTTVMYESPPAGWIDYPTPAYVAGRAPQDFSMMVIAAGTAAKMRQCVDLAKARNMDYLYVTHDKGANPYDALPSYWTEEVARVAAP